MPHDFELKPQRIQPVREASLEATAAQARGLDPKGPDSTSLSQTAFRCGGWSVRGPSGWRQWGVAERASAVLGTALFAGLGLVGVLVPVAPAVGLLRLVGALP